MAKKLDILLKKREQIKHQIKLVVAKEKNRERKQDTRRKILLGAMLQVWIDQDDAMKEAVNKRLQKFLERSVDREVFGFDQATSNQDAAALRVEKSA
jgi:hypothetical protein